MFRAKFLIGCIFIVAGIAWPTVSITRGLTRFSSVYRTAAQERRAVQPFQQREVVVALEQASASLVGGVVMGLFGIGVALGKKRDAPEPVAVVPQRVGD